MKRLKGIYRYVSLSLLILVLFSASTFATTIVVTNLNDSGAGSLRQTITDAASGDTIDFSVTGPIILTSGQLVIDKSLTIQGPGASLLSISGNHASRVFSINSTLTATLDGMTIRDGLSDYGAGIVNQGTLTISNCTIFANQVSECQDICASIGGGMYNSVDASLTITNSTISGNATAEYGGGIFNYGTLTLSNSTISNNTARDGGGIYLFGGTETLVNTIVSGNAGFDSPPSDIYGQIDIASHNLIGDAASSGGIQHGVNGNIVGKNPMLGPLRNNGGSTMTQALLPGSPAVNAGDNALAIGPTDQRGAGFARILDGTVDIGSFELQTKPSIRR